MPREFINDNLTFKVGKDAQDNWDLVDESVEGDIWIHLHDYPSGHVIIENTRDIQNSDILYGCVLCKENSKYKYKKNIRCSVLDRKYIKKGKSKGEVKLLKSPIIITV